MHQSTASSPKATILFIDDEPKIIRRVGDILAESFTVIRAGSAADGLALLDEHPEISVVVCDHQMPGMSGIEFFRSIRKSHPLVVRILATALQRYSILVDAINDAQVFGYIDKAWSFELYRMIIDDAVSHYHCGSSTSPVMDIPTGKFQSRSEIIIDGSYVEDFRELLGLMIHIERKALPDQSLEGSLSIVRHGEDLIVSYIDPIHRRAQSRRLQHFRGEIENAIHVDRLSEKALEVDCEVTSLPNVMRKDGCGALAHPSSILEKRQLAPWLVTEQVVRLQAALNQIQCHLSIILSRSSRRGKALDPFGSANRGDEFIADLEKLIARCRELHESNDVSFQDYSILKKDLAGVLDSVNQQGSLLRGILLSGTIDGSVVNGLFVVYNSLGAFGPHSTIIPDSALFAAAKLVDGGSREKLTLGVLLALLAFGPVIWMGVVASSTGNHLEFFKTSNFLVVVVIALASAIIGGFFAGKAAVNGLISIPYLSAKPFRLAATSGFAIFFIVLLVGCWFLGGGK